jgi:hypothetical protein
MIRRLFLKLFRRRRMQQDLEAELAFHREMSAAAGNPIPFGNAGLIKEQASICGVSARSRTFGGTLFTPPARFAGALASW